MGASCGSENDKDITKKMMALRAKKEEIQGQKNELFKEYKKKYQISLEREGVKEYVKYKDDNENINQKQNLKNEKINLFCNGLPYCKPCAGTTQS